MSQYTNESRVFGGVKETVAAGSSVVVKVAGCAGLVAYFAGTTTCVARACDPDGTAIPNSANLTLTSGVLLSAAAHFYKISPTTGSAIVLVIG